MNGIKMCDKEFLLWLSRLWTQLVSMRTWVRSLAWLNRLRIQHCHCGQRCGLGLVLWLWHRPAATADLTPSLGTSICHGCSPKKTKKKKRKSVIVYTQHTGILFGYEKEGNSFATTWIALEGFMLIKISQRKTNNIWSYSYIKSKKAKLRSESRIFPPRIWGVGEMVRSWSKGTKLAVLS